MIRIGIDIGGTFTDFVIYKPEDGSLITFKLPSTPHNPAEAVLTGLRQVPDLIDAAIIHGSTVATNALLERKGAKTALVATKGFKDVIQIGRQNRPRLYDWFYDPPPPLVPAELRFEIDERVEHDGGVSKGIDASDIDALINQLKGLGVESIGICFLFSYLQPSHEKIILEKLRQAGYQFISCSHEILPQFREYERMSTTVVNAYVSPKLSYYLGDLQISLPSSHLHIMQSNGGMISIPEAKSHGVRCILSGPAGGIVGATYIAHTTRSHNESKPSYINIITFDMGGTSTDVSLISEEPVLTTESIIGGMPIALPFLDIHTIGAGGGSIATADIAGALRVGPESAGAYPGPACYGHGSSPTVTDANLILGRILPEFFLGGSIKLNIERSTSSIQHLGDRLGLDAFQTALGMIEVVNAHMERAIRVISVERGHDPQDFSLFTFGGAGGLHATNLARRVGIPTVIIPPLASTLSAFGMLAADYIKDYSRTVMIAGETDSEELETIFTPLIQRAYHDLVQEGFCRKKIRIEQSVDMRYVGQSYELTLRLTTKLNDDFALIHQKHYGYHIPHAQTEIVNIRIRAIGCIDKPILRTKENKDSDPAPALIKMLPVGYDSGMINTPFYSGELLRPGAKIDGPAIIVRPDTTIFLDTHDFANIDEFLNIIVIVD